MSQSNYLENKALDHNLGTTTFTKPTNVYLALYSTNPTDADSGTEVTGGSYARQLVTWAAAASGSKASNIALTFTNMPTVTVSHFGIRDASTGGNLLYHGAWAAPVAYTAGDDATVASGALTVTHD